MFLSSTPFSFMVIDSEKVNERWKWIIIGNKLLGRFSLGGCAPIDGLLMFRAFNSSSVPAFVPQMMYFLLSHSGAGFSKTVNGKSQVCCCQLDRKTKNIWFSCCTSTWQFALKSSREVNWEICVTHTHIWTELPKLVWASFLTR